MILAAGRGERMRPLTNTTPKPMLPLLGKPALEYLVEHLVAHGFGDMMINVSHLPEKIENYFGDGRRWGARIGYSFEGHIARGEIVGCPLGSAGGLKRVHEFGGFFDETFLVVCGDAIFDLDLTAALRRHKNSGAAASVVVKPMAPKQLSNYGIAACDARGRIISFQEKPAAAEAKSNLINTGIYFFEPEVLTYIPSDKNYDIGGQLLPDLVAKKIHAQAIELNFHWMDIGRPYDYWRAQQKLMRGAMRDVNMPGEQIAPGIWRGLNAQIARDARLTGPVYIGANARVDAGCELVGPTWIAPGCVVRRGAKIQRSMLFEYTSMRAGANLADAIVSPRFCIDKNGTPLAQLSDYIGDARGG